jgi:hypothetical protein
MVGPVVKVFRRQNVNTPLSRVMAWTPRMYSI